VKLARRLEEQAEGITDAYPRCVRSEDERAAFRAAAAWLSRAYERPKETIGAVKPGELSTGFDPADIAKIGHEERHALIRRLSEQHPDLARPDSRPLALDRVPKGRFGCTPGLLRPRPSPG
jgi:hypothetical protein